VVQGEEYDRYFEILEIPPGSTIAEVNTAYNHLRQLYSTESMVTSPVANDISEEQRARVLKQLEEAHAKLVRFLRKGKGEVKPSPKPDDDLKAEIADTVFNGEALKRVREKMEVELHEVELATKVRVQYLQHIEFERFESLPEAVFIKGYLNAYARYLSLDAGKVQADYMKGYEQWKQDKGSGQAGK
jgi:hypothetical protein